LKRELKGKPIWIEVQSQFVIHPYYAGTSLPRNDASPATYHWQIVAAVTVNQQQVDQEAAHKGC